VKSLSGYEEVNNSERRRNRISRSYGCWQGAERHTEEHAAR
jgi:hypothetical protein